MKEGDFVEIEYEGYSNGEKFDSGKFVIPVGKGEIVKGLDEEIVKHKVGDEFEVDVPPEKGFGKRNRNLVQIIPLGQLSKHNVNPKPGMVLNINGLLGKVLSVSGGRVIVDFNHPLSGKVLHYHVKIIREVKDTKEKIKGYVKMLTDKEVDVKEENGKFIISGNVENKEFILEKLKNLLGVDVSWK